MGIYSGRMEYAFFAELNTGGLEFALNIENYKIMRV